MTHRSTAFVSLLVVLATAPALACEPVASVKFNEAAPKDIFAIKNTSSEWSLTQLTLDLTSSNGKMLFDTAVGGTGENVAQPFEILAGSAVLRTAPDITDGDTKIELRFDTFAPGDDFEFTIDVDDTLVAGEKGRTMIGASEIEGALIQVTLLGSNGAVALGKGRFGPRNKAMIELPVCS